MTGCYFKGWLIDRNVDWDFSATCKGAIDGLGSTCKCRVHEKPLPTPVIYKTYFAKCAAAVCPGITILHCSKTDAEEIKAALDNGTLVH